MVIEKLKNAVVFLDTAPLIYFIEGHSGYQDKLAKLFKLNDENHLKFITSAITLLEVLVKPTKDGETKIVDQYKMILTNADGIDIFDITTQIAVKAADLRAKYNIRTPDALQIATAVIYESDYFLTNDLRLKNITEINLLTIAELV